MNHKNVALTAESGIGKTFLAKQYAIEHSQIAFFFNSDSIETGFVDCFKSLVHEEASQIVRLEK